MANQKALFTSQSDFTITDPNALTIDPFLYSDAEDLSNVSVIGTPAFVDGVKGQAVEHGGVSAYKWNNANYPSATRRVVSFWFTPTADDLTGWKILATNRGDGWANYGVHIALYDGKLNVRGYGSNGSLSLYTDGVDFPYWIPTAGETYHLAVIFDESATFPLEVYLNKQRIMYNSTNLTFGSYTRSFTIGDMLTSSGTLSPGYVFNGVIDEPMFVLDGFSNEDIFRYYDEILNPPAPTTLDYTTIPGSLILPTDSNGEYMIPAINEWISPTVDLGVMGFQRYGRVQVNYDTPNGTYLNTYTRTSNDGVNWDAWIKIREDGIIDSQDKQYIQVKVEMGTTFLKKTPQLDEIQILDYGTVEKIPLVNAPLKVYKDLADGLEYAGEFQHAFDIIVEAEVNGESLLTFKLPIDDPKRIELGDEPVELIVEIAGKRYIIRELVDRRDDDGKMVSAFKCEALWYELRDYKVPKKITLEQTTAFNAVNTLLANAEPACPWTLTVCEIPADKLRDITFDWKSVLGGLQDIIEKFGGELVFDETNKEIKIVESFGEDRGVRFYYTKNLKGIVRTVDTYDLVTRLYPYGSGGLTIETVNNGVSYIENLTWVNALNLRNKVRIDRWKNESYLYPQNLKDDGEKLLEEWAKPRFQYVITVQDLSLLSGHEHESFNLGDTVYTVDKELLSTEVKSRIVRMKYNVREPWKTVVELSQPKKTLADAMKREIDEKMEGLETADLMNTSDVRQMSVFNYLLNSRADEGFTDWIQEGTGFRLGNAGFSGDWSFVCDGEFGKVNTLTQRIFGVSHRNSYTVSTAVATEGTITRGGTLAEPFAGIKVIIHYKDGTTEEKFLALDDESTPQETY